MALKTGELNERVTIERPTRTPNDSGGAITTYSALLSTWARVRELKSTPELLEGREQITQLIEILMRYRPDVAIQHGDRLTWRGFTFIINNMRVDPMRTSITITAASEIETAVR